VVKILSVGEDQDVAVIGTLYKDMRLKPSILDEYAKDPGLKAALGGSCFCSDDDSLVLEDEGARMTLRSECGDLMPDAVVTGGGWRAPGGAHVTRTRDVHS
jgi:DNA polymerase delta subunit 2